jgi:hypothetical protein
MSEMFQFGGPGTQFDYTSSSYFWCYHDGIENGAFSGDKSQGASSMNQNPFADGDQMFSWSGSATPGDHLFFPCDSTPPSSISTPTRAGVLRVGNSQDTTYSDIDQGVPLFGGDETKDVEDASTSEMGQAQISAKRIPALLIPVLLAGNQHSLAACVLSLSKLASLKYPR